MQDEAQEQRVCRKCGENRAVNVLCPECAVVIERFDVYAQLDLSG